MVPVSDGDDTFSDIREVRHRHRQGEGWGYFLDRGKPELGLGGSLGGRVEAPLWLRNLKLVRIWNLSSGPQ